MSQMEEKESNETSPELKTSSNGPLKALPFDPTVRHPLKTAWTLWYDDSLAAGKRPPTDTWGAQIKEVFTFDTVEDFWRLFNNVAPPSNLGLGCTYNVFRKGIEPKWEDPNNAQGGRWTIIVQKKDRHMLDKLWLWLLLGCIGETIDEEDQLCGAVINIRKGQEKLSIWTKDAENRDACIKMGQNFKKVLELPAEFPCGYSVHLGKNSRNNKYEV